MYRLLFCLLAVIGAPTLSAAQSAPSDLRLLDTLQDGQGWGAVGRLDIGETGFCTAVLIDDSLILTAAHCVYDAHGTLIPTDHFTFQAGLKNGRADATRGIRRVAAHPDYTPGLSDAGQTDVAHDIAVLEITQPIRRNSIQPFAFAPGPLRGDTVAIVSYGRDRAHAPSLQESCTVLGQQNAALVMNCAAEYGSSGAPVFDLSSGQPRIVSIVSAVAQSGESDVSLGTALLNPLQELLIYFANVPSTGFSAALRPVAGGDRNDTGAKFIKPEG